MGISAFKTRTIMPEQIDIQTAFNIWNLLVARYESIQSTQFFKNFVHDRDLQLVMDMLLNNLINQETHFEKEAKRFNIKLPSRPAFEIKSSVKVNEMTDKFIYTRTFSDMLSELFSLARSVRNTLTNDRLRKLFTDFLLTHTKQYENLYKYAKLKGWEEVDPAYKTAKSQEKEPLSISEAFHIWDHLRQRYNQLQLTLFFEGFAHDTDFKAGMVIAVRTLENQIKKLQDLAIKYEIAMPERPPASMKVAIDPESAEDKFMYQQMLMGIDNMVDMHIRASIEILRNDSLRAVFTILFKDELDIHDNMVKYGKAKGWLTIPPVYSQH